VVLSHVTLQHITLGIEEKSKHVSLAQQNDFGPTCFCWYKGQESCAPAKE
jgi:hypothetical protein